MSTLLTSLPRLLSAVLAVAALTPLAAAQPAGRDPDAEVIILDYHTFIGKADSAIDFSPEEFAAHLDRMQAMGYRFVRLEDAMEGRISGKNNLALTIDDGNHSVWQAAEKAIDPRGIPAYLFVYPGIIDARKFALTAAQLLSLRDRGYGIGAHGWFHEYMTPKAWRNNRDKVMLEVTRSGPGLAAFTGVPPVHFAYPFGVGAPEAGKELAARGYRYIYLADTVVVPVRPNAPDFNPLAIPRTLVYRSYLPVMWKKLEAHLTR